MKPRTQPLRKQRRGESALLTRQLDIQWALVVKHRAGGRCERCGRSEGQLQSHHVVGRSNHRVRWTPENGVSLCAWTCHKQWAHHEPLEFTDWIRSYRPSDVVYVRSIKNEVANWTIPQKREKLAQLKEMLAELRSLSQDSDEREAAT